MSGFYPKIDPGVLLFFWFGQRSRNKKGRLVLFFRKDKMESFFEIGGKQFLRNV